MTLPEAISAVPAPPYQQGFSRLTENVVDTDYSSTFVRYLRGDSISPLAIHGDSSKVLAALPSKSVDCAITSPPYWNKREYANGGLGLEKTYAEYIRNLTDILAELKRVLKPEGSLWLNIGDTYQAKQLIGIPWRVALELTDSQGWILRNSIIWNKVKSGMDNTRDRLGNVHETVFHFVKQPSYHYDVDSIRSTPRSSKIVNGKVISATGVSGVRYRRQIELSTALSAEEKEHAFQALSNILDEVGTGRITDFRMIIRGQQRTTHSDSGRVSGRARELMEKGFYFLRSHPQGSKPTDVWDILPEDTQNRALHFAPFPEELCQLPILATCPPDGVVIDPFCGTGTSLFAAQRLNRKSVGIDIAREYLDFALQRCSGGL